MSQKQNPETFAYGANKLDNCNCPAVQAGFDPTSGHYTGHIPGILDAAEQYDAILSEREGTYDGLVPREVAKNAWLTMIDNCINEETKRMATKVAIELGWMESY